MFIVSISGNDAVVLEHEATIAGLIDLLGKVAQFNKGSVPEVTYRKIPLVMGGGAVAVNSAFLAIMQKIAEMEKGGE